jgi:transketolase
MNMSLTPDFESMKRFSADIRIETTKAIATAGFGHIGGSASIADVLAVLYGGVMKIDPSRPDWPERDWFVLSKGHAGPALYATLGLKGYFPMDWLATVNKPGTMLPSHADRLRTPGVDMTTGSLGQGISCAVGIAMANRFLGKDSYTYCIVGDGELNEGQVWEAVEAANHHRLDRLIVFVDWNKKQIDGRLEEISDPCDIEEKFRAFGFDAQTVKGHDVKEIYNAIMKAKENTQKPHAIVLDTIKGKGITIAEQVEFNHYLTFGPKEAEGIIAEIERRYEAGTYPGGESK